MNKIINPKITHKNLNLYTEYISQYSCLTLILTLIPIAWSGVWALIDLRGIPRVFR